MSAGFLRLLDNTEETVFLPAGTFGYLYAKYQALSVCPSLSPIVPSLGLPRIALFIAAGSAILAAFMYTRLRTGVPTEPKNIRSTIAFTSVLQLLLLIWSFL